MKGAPKDEDEVGETEDDLQDVVDGEQMGGARDTAHLDGVRTEFRVGMWKEWIWDWWVESGEMGVTEVAIGAARDRVVGLVAARTQSSREMKIPRSIQNYAIQDGCTV